MLFFTHGHWGSGDQPVWKARVLISLQTASLAITTEIPPGRPPPPPRPTLLVPCRRPTMTAPQRAERTVPSSDFSFGTLFYTTGYWCVFVKPEVAQQSTCPQLKTEAQSHLRHPFRPIERVDMLEGILCLVGLQLNTGFLFDVLIEPLLGPTFRPFSWV